MATHDEPQKIRIGGAGYGMRRVIGVLAGIALIAAAFYVYIDDAAILTLCELLYAGVSTRGVACVSQRTLGLIALALGVVGGFILGYAVVSRPHYVRDPESGRVTFGDGEQPALQRETKRQRKKEEEKQEEEPKLIRFA